MTIIIGICGRSCSGKGIVSHALGEHISKQFSVTDIQIISQDWYYLGGNEKTNFDEPNSVDFQLLISDLQALKDGQVIHAPQYDFKTHSRMLDVTKRITPAPIIIVEGILIFHMKQLYELFNLKVFVSAFPEICFHRRIQRDVKERGRSEKEVIERYVRDVLPSACHFIDPTEENADIIVKNNKDGHFVGLDVLKAYISHTLLSNYHS